MNVKFQFVIQNLVTVQMFVTTAMVHVFLQIHVTVTVDTLEMTVQFQFVSTHLQIHQEYAAIMEVAQLQIHAHAILVTLEMNAKLQFVMEN